MNGNIKKILVAALILIGVFANWVTFAEALDVKLLWKKEFKHGINALDLATETGDVLISLNKKEIILFDKSGNERFHWGPRIDRACGVVSISKDGKYFVFTSGYTERFAEVKKLPWWSDDRIHFIEDKTKKEIWNFKSPESIPSIFPDGTSTIIYDNRGFDIFNIQGRKTFEYHQGTWGLSSFCISPDSNYFAVVQDSRQPIMLFQKNGVKLWEQGRYNRVSSISDGASYLSTFPYYLGPSDPPDPEKLHEGIIYDKNGNIVLKGFGFLSGDGRKIAVYSPEKITVVSLPSEIILKEIPIQIRLPKISNPIFVIFSHDGRYLVLKNAETIFVLDLEEDKRWDTAISGLGDLPKILITRNGKYLLVLPEVGNKSLYFYQLYN